MEKCKDSIWKWGITKFFPQSCHNGFLLAPFRWERLTFHAKFPKKWKPKLQLVDQRCTTDSSHPVVALAGCFPGKSPGWDGFPAPTGILLGSCLFPSPHTCSSTLWLQLSQLILVRQLLEGCLCVPGALPDVRGWCQRWNSHFIFCGSEAVASVLSSPQKPPPQLRVKHAGKGPRKGKLGVCLSKSHGSELVAIIP